MPVGERVHVFVPDPARHRVRHFVTPDGLRLDERPPCTVALRHPAGGVELAAGVRYRMLAALRDGAPQIVTAESPDLASWEPMPGAAPIEPDGRWYADAAAEGFAADWDDPFLRYDRTAGLYRLLFAARRPRGGKPHTRACVGAAVSADLRDWELRPPVFAPGRHERIFAPCLLSNADRHSLLYHTRAPNGSVTLHHASADGMAGPFDAARDNVLMSARAMLARPADFGGVDTVFFVGTHETGFSLWPAALSFAQTGRPRLRLHPSVAERTTATAEPLDVTIESDETLIRLLPHRTEDFMLTGAVSGEATLIGLALRTSVTGHRNNTLWVDPFSRRISLHEGASTNALVSAPYRGDAHLTVVARGRLIAVYVGGNLKLLAQACRLSGGLGLAVSNGTATFSGLTLSTLG